MTGPDYSRCCMWGEGSNSVLDFTRSQRGQADTGETGSLSLVVPELLLQLSGTTEAFKSNELSFVLHSVIVYIKLNTKIKKEVTERTGGDTGSQLKVSEATTIVGRGGLRTTQTGRQTQRQIERKRECREGTGVKTCVSSSVKTHSTSGLPARGENWCRPVFLTAVSFCGACLRRHAPLKAASASAVKPEHHKTKQRPTETFALSGRLNERLQSQKPEDRGFHLDILSRTRTGKKA